MDSATSRAFKRQVGFVEPKDLPVLNLDGQTISPTKVTQKPVEAHQAIYLCNVLVPLCRFTVSLYVENLIPPPPRENKLPELSVRTKGH